MTTKKESQIKELQEKIDKLKLEIEQEKSKDNLIDIKSLRFKTYKCLPKIEVSQIIDWNKPYKDIIIPQGLRLIKIQELIEILESSEEKQFLEKYKEIYNYFWCYQTKYDKNFAGARRLYRGSGGDWFAGWYDLDGSGVAGRVVFVRDLKKVKK